MPFCAHTKCGLPFTEDNPGSNKPQIYCKRPKCIKSRRREQQSKTGRRCYIAPTQEIQRPLVFCSEGCGRKTRNRTGKCDSCRYIIIRSIDMDFLSMAL